MDSLYLKQSIIVTINMLNDKLGNESQDFNTLVQMDYSALEEIRDELLPEYNQMIKDTK